MKRPSKEYLEQMTWEEKAQKNPIYAVMSKEEFAESGAEPTLEELERFYKRGTEMVMQWISPWLVETQTATTMNILEFGCGMGRLVKALANDHPATNIFGVDISPTMISHARKNVPDGPSFAVTNEDGRLPYQDAFFDRIYSYAVFQHIPTKSAVVRTLSELARVLKPGGLVKLNFEMAFPPPFESSLQQDTFALEQRFAVYGWVRKHGLPIWRLRICRTNNWNGIRLGYSQLTMQLQRVGIRTYGIVRQHSTRGMIWFYGEKRPH